MNDFSDEVQELLEYIRKDDNDISKYSSNDLLEGIDYLCRTLFGVVGHELTSRSWAQLGFRTQREILFHYRELGRQGERLYDDLTRSVPYLGNGEPSDIESLIQNSWATQQIAAMPLRSKELDPKIMKSLVQATLEAVLSAAPMLVFIPTARHGYYNGNVDGGLQNVRRVVLER